MNYCSNCGVQLAEGANFCSHCGQATQPSQQPPQQQPGTQPSESVWGFSLLGFFLPIVGLVLYLVWHDTLPQRSRAAGIGALIGACFPIILIVFLISLTFFILSMV